MGTALAGIRRRRERVATTALPAEVTAARAIARDIKDAARAGRTSVPEALLESADRSALSRYVAARLMRNPFDDATRMIREFPR